MTDRNPQRFQQALFSAAWLVLGILAAVYGFYVVAAVFTVMFLIWFPWEMWRS